MIALGEMLVEWISGNQDDLKELVVGRRAMLVTRPARFVGKKVGRLNGDGCGECCTESYSMNYGDVNVAS